MRKIRITLIDITVFAVIVVALAFKVAKINTTLFCSTNPSEYCPLEVSGTFTESITPYRKVWVIGSIAHTNLVL